MTPSGGRPWLWRARALPFGLVALAVVYGLVIYHGELSPPVHLNDSGMHLSMTRWAANRLREGHNPFDGWYPYLGVGFPQTHHYQSLPHVVTAFVGLVIGVSTAYNWSLFLLLAGWPVALYVSARLLGFERLEAACVGLVAPVVISTTNYGYEAGSYTWAGYGIWPQLWAMWLLPITLGLAHQSLRGRLHPAIPAAALAATVACHFITGWLALALVGVLPLLDIRRVRDRAARMARMLLGALGLLAWVLLPLWLDGAGADYTGYGDGNVFNDSHGARKILGWLVRGELFDTKRVPVVTVLAAIGLVVAARKARDHVGHRVVLLISAASLVLFFGRPTLGPLLDLLPLGDQLFYPRFILGVHLGGVLLAGVGLAAALTVLTRQLSRFGPPLLAGAVVAVMAFIATLDATSDRAIRERDARNLMSAQDGASSSDGADFDRLLDRIPPGSGRVYAGTSYNWGRTYLVGFVPAYAVLLARDVESVGFLLRVSSLGTMAEEPFNEANPADYAALGVAWLVAPADREPPVPATLVATEGRHRLFAVPTPGYAEVVDVAGVADADPDTIRTVGRVTTAAVEPVFRTAARPLIRWRGEAGEPPAAPAAVGSPGEVVTGAVQSEEGRFSFDVQAARDAYLAVAVSWHPRLQATVDGDRVDVSVIAPGTAGVPVPAGRHVVKVAYRPFPFMIVVLLLGVGVFVAAGWMTSDRMRRVLPSRVARRVGGADHHG